MTKKLEELLNLAPLDESTETSNEEPSLIEEKQDIIRQVDRAIDKIDAALPMVRELEAADQEMDDLADLAEEKFKDLMDLGMNVEPRYSGVILQTASTLLGHAITAKTAKMDKKLKMIQLQLSKARLDHQINKEQPEDAPIEGHGVVLDRNEILRQVLAAARDQKDKPA
jgi:hypothetical protein